MELLSLLNELKQMKWIDLSHEFGENTPRWPGFESLRKEIKLEFGEYPVRAYQYSFPGQYGTHVDVPGHADVNGRTLEKIDIKECVLPLCVINCSDKVKMNSDYALSLDDIHDYVHIVDATVEEMKREGMSEGLLLGTRFTMEESFNKERFYKNGVNIIIPSLEERQLVHDIIFAELCRGIITNNSKEQYKKIIYKYCKGKETGVILGCTEIGLLIQQNFMDVPIFDTTQIHAKKIAMYMIE